MTDPDFSDPFLAPEQPSGFQRMMGYRIADWRDGHAELIMPLRPHHLNRAGVVHGGVLVSLIDTACGFAGTWCPVPGNTRKAVTLSLTTSFLSQARHGTLRAVADIRGGGRKIFTATAEILDEHGTLIAVGQGTFRYRSGSEAAEGVPVA